jgi:hypothetical protein
MRNIRVLGVALAALCAFGVVVASASGATFLLAEWLEEALPMSEKKPVESTATELELVNHNAANLGITAKVKCSGTLVGTVGPESSDEITELLNLAKEAISKTPLSGLALEGCTNIENCSSPLVWADLETPWRTEAELMEEGTETFFVDLLFNGGYYVECSSILGPIAELCSSTETAIQLTNETNGTVDALFSDTFQVLAGLKLGTCTGGGVETAEVNNLGTIALVSGKALSVSSE